MIKFKHNGFSIILLSILTGCSFNNLDSIRNSNNTTKSDLEKRSKARSLTIKNSNTFYSKKLENLGCAIRKVNSAVKTVTLSKGGNYPGPPRISVASILDKTQKVYPKSETALSDLVINALTKVSGFEVIETPLGTDSISASRNNFLDTAYPMRKVLQENIVATTGRSNFLPIGITFPSDYYITGALVQYDESSEFPNPSTSVDIDIFKHQRDISAINVGIQLRLIETRTGTVVTNTNKNKTASVLLSNKFYTKRIKNNLFRLVSSKDYGINHEVTVADPKHYAIQEMVEKAVLEILSTEVPNQFINSCPKG